MNKPNLSSSDQCFQFQMECFSLYCASWAFWNYCNFKYVIVLLREHLSDVFFPKIWPQDSQFPGSKWLSHFCFDFQGSLEEGKEMNLFFPLDNRFCLCLIQQKEGTHTYAHLRITHKCSYTHRHTYVHRYTHIQEKNNSGGAVPLSVWQTDSEDEMRRK